jgi:hypothetical protein
VLPGGLAIAAFLAVAPASVEGESCTSNPTSPASPHGAKAVNAGTDCVSSGGSVNYFAIALVVVLIVLPVLTSIYLGRRLTRVGAAA